jgi:hypothetical protein
MTGKPDLKTAERRAPVEVCLKQDQGGTILSYDNLR